MSIGDVCAIIGAFTSLVSVGYILIKIGGLLNVIESLTEKLKTFENMALQWQAVLVRLGMVEVVQAKNTSDIRELLRADSEVREELASMHDD